MQPEVTLSVTHELVVPLGNVYESKCRNVVSHTGGGVGVGVGVTVGVGVGVAQPNRPGNALGAAQVLAIWFRLRRPVCCGSVLVMLPDNIVGGVAHEAGLKLTVKVP